MNCVQSTKPLYQIKSAEARQVFAQTLPKVNTPIAADFIAKLEIALKETNETGKWLEMLWRSEYIDEARHKALDKTCSTIRFLLVRSIQTAKQNANK